jgi:hypothetical protein
MATAGPPGYGPPAYGPPAYGPPAYGPPALAGSIWFANHGPVATAPIPNSPTRRHHSRFGSSRLKPAVLAASALILATLTFAQDSRPSDDAARRLHELVDQTLEQLRAELHREIDAVRQGDEYRSYTLKEMRELVRRRTLDELKELTTAVGQEPVNQIPTGMKLVPASTEFHEVHGLAPGAASRVDAVLPGSQAERLGIRPGDFFLWARGLRSIRPVVAVIRWNERINPVAEPAPSETAREMVDRMWDEAVQKTLKNGVEIVPVGAGVSESQPVRK